MKKLVLLLITCFSIFAFTSNVKAYKDFPVDNISSDDAIILNTYGYTQDELYEFAEAGYYLSGSAYNYSSSTNKYEDFTKDVIDDMLYVRQYYETNYADTYNSYFIVLYFGNHYSSYVSLDYIYLYFWNSSEIDVNNLSGNLLNRYNFTKLYNHYHVTDFSIKSSNSGDTVKKVTFSYSYKTLSLSSTSDVVDYDISTQSMMSYTICIGSTNTNYWSNYYESNVSVDVNLISTDASYSSGGVGYYTYSSFIYDNVTYEPGEYVFNTKSGLGVPDKETITFSVDSQTDEELSIKTTFSSYNTDKYTYLYKFVKTTDDIDDISWKNISDNDFVYSSKLNGTLYINVVDKTIFESSGELETIASGTFTYSGLADALSLSYKTGFISSDAYSVLGKVTIDFDETDTNIVGSNYALFKLQFGANDFTKDNIPVFSHYKIYSRANEYDTWQELDEDDLLSPVEELEDGTVVYADHSLQILDTTFDYVEPDAESGIGLADASITLRINFDELDYIDLNTTDLTERYWKIEFYFDNTQNGFIYVYDSLENSEWSDTSKFLDDYIYYFFPANYSYAFITSENEENTGIVYFPTYGITNELIKLQGQYYNLSSKDFSFPISSITYSKDSYYSYINFNFNQKKQLLVLNRAYGGQVEMRDYYYYNGKFAPVFTSGFTLDYVYEDIYFYAPIGYKVYFTNNTNITVLTSEGSVIIDINNSNNEYKNEISDSSDNSVYVSDFISFINDIDDSIQYARNLLTMLFTELPDLLQGFIIFIFNLLCIFMLLRMGGWFG